MRPHSAVTCGSRMGYPQAPNPLLHNTATTLTGCSRATSGCYVCLVNSDGAVKRRGLALLSCRGVLCFWVLSAVASCSGSGPQAQVEPASPVATAPSAEPTGAADCPLAGESSTLLIAGQDALNASLFRFDLCSGRSEQVGDLSRYSDISAAGSRVVVSNAASGPDRIAALAPSGQLTALPGLESPDGLSPEVDSAGRVAFVQLTNDEKPFALRLLAAGRGVKTLLTSAVPLSSPAFGPRGLVAVAADPDETIGGSGPTLLVLLDPQTAREISRAELPVPDAGALVWNEQARLIAVQDISGDQTLLVEPSSGRVLRKVEGWSPRTITPDGTRLLLERAGRFGLLPLPAATAPVTPLAVPPPGEVAGIAFAPTSYADAS